MNPADQIIDSCRDVARQHFPAPEDREFRLDCYACLLETKLREVLYRAPALTVRGEAVDIADLVGEKK